MLAARGAALFLASGLSGAITGETIYVDCGYNIMGFYQLSRILQLPCVGVYFPSRLSA
jgi:hypothetical protein